MILYIIGVFIAFALGYLCCALCADGRITDAERRYAELVETIGERTRGMGKGQ